MQGRLTTRPARDVISAIQALDLESVKLRLMDPELGRGWSREYADSIEAAYKNYLKILVKYQEDAQDILLSKEVDEFWHAHILQTVKYADDCQKVFGTFLHHNPYIGERTPDLMEKRAVAAQKTRRLYQLEFGTALVAEAAWSGQLSDKSYCDAAKPATAAYCDLTRQAPNYDVNLRPRNAAYCDVSVVEETAAYCDAATTRHTIAYCDAAVRTDKAAYCDLSVRMNGTQPQQSAYCDASIDKQRTATPCNLSTDVPSAAYCDAAVPTGQAAYCDVSTRG